MAPRLHRGVRSNCVVAVPACGRPPQSMRRTPRSARRPHDVPYSGSYPPHNTRFTPPTTRRPAVRRRPRCPLSTSPPTARRPPLSPSGWGLRVTGGRERGER
uniref:Uncharacterized protein n=1 Tax=Oryza sativa subsp. japonica TaxID=39947 RepID=Q651C0_ORYSJ|nr:hypothetical protein [Oryza sativa Japonica Group]